MSHEPEAESQAAVSQAPSESAPASPAALSKDITTRVLALLVVASGRSVDEIHLESHLVDDLDLDSLDVANYVSMLEEEFGITVDEDAILTSPTVSGVITHVLSRVKM